ncbi:MAG: GNAT family N-acetyltransferase [Planctomycetes bacterium]|nr:GNAT family N-acetyltransferase [Planctomycetota bacterium]
MRPNVTLRQVEGGDDLAAVRQLLLEYGRTPGWAACFQSFELELAELPGDCAPPEGRLLLARIDGEAAGVVALRPLGAGVAELRRLYVRPGKRGMGLGRKLVERALAEARESGHARVVLHTLPAMSAAHALYTSLGFQPSEPYAEMPVGGALFLAREVDATRR